MDKNILTYWFCITKCPEKTTIDNLHKDFDNIKLCKQSIVGNDIDFIYGMSLEIISMLALQKSVNNKTNYMDELNLLKDKYVKLFESVYNIEQLEAIEFNLNKNKYIYTDELDLTKSNKIS